MQFVSGRLTFRHILKREARNYMKLVASLLLISIATLVSGQDNWENLVQWETRYDKENNVIDLQANITKGWVIYSQYTPDEGPIPLTFEFEQTKGVEFIGDVEELDEPIKEVSTLFEMEVLKFKETASFQQSVKVAPDAKRINGTVTFMACDHEKCLPPKTVPFTVKL